jgi:hypothetical protein
MERNGKDHLIGMELRRMDLMGFDWTGPLNLFRLGGFS